MSIHSPLLAFLSEQVVVPLQTAVVSPLLPLHLLTTLHAVRVALEFRRSRVRLHADAPLPWLQGLSACMAMAMGGTTLSAFLLGVPPGWLVSNITLPTYAGVYALIFHSPSDAPFRVLDAMGPVLDPILIIADGFARALAQASGGADLARLVLPGSHVAALICTTLSGCGGGIIADAFSLSDNVWSLKVPAQLSSPSIDLRTSLALAGLYTLSTDPTLYGPLHAYFIADSPSAKLPIFDGSETRVIGCLFYASSLLWKRYGASLTPTVQPAPSRSRKGGKGGPKEE